MAHVRTAERSPERLGSFVSRYGYSIFCDDVRHGEGDKLDFIGCYNGVMLVEQALPVTLRRFCVHAHFVSPAAEPFDMLSLRVYEPGTDHVIFEEPLDIGRPADPHVPIRDRFGAPRLIVAAATIMFTPLYVEQAGLLRVRAVVDDDPAEVPLGSLFIRRA